MYQKIFDIFGASAQQRRNKLILRITNIEPNDFGRSSLQYAHPDEILVPSYQHKSAVAGNVPHRCVGRAASTQSADMRRSWEDVDERIQQTL